MCRQHVVVGGDDRQVRSARAGYAVLVLQRRGEAMSEVGAGEEIAIPVPLALALHEVEIAAAAVPRARDDPFGDAGDGGIEVCHGQRS